MEYTGDRPREPAYEIKLMLSRVSWALAQICCYCPRASEGLCCVRLIFFSVSMNRCTQPGEILHEHVPWQPHDAQRISRS